MVGSDSQASYMAAGTPQNKHSKRQEVEAASLLGLAQKLGQHIISAICTTGQSSPSVPSTPF